MVDGGMDEAPPIQRAVRALGASAMSTDGGICSMDGWFDEPELRTMVLAVLLAIREPSGDMLGDVHDTLLYHRTGEELDTARIVWDRMVECLIEDVGHPPHASEDVEA